MRRSDREIVDLFKIEQIMCKCEVCRLAFNDNEKVYIVPINFGYIYENGKFTLYFHGAKEGKKVDLINKMHYAGFEMDTNYRIQTADIACEHTAFYQSIIGDGSIKMVTDMEEKKLGLQMIMMHITEKRNWEFSDEMLERTGVFKLEVNVISCKEH